jgi:hypothetical protein
LHGSWKVRRSRRGLVEYVASGRRSLL